MPTFEYIALDAKGKQTRGSVAAESAAAARSVLRNRRVHATRLRPVSEAAHTRGLEWSRMFRARRRREVLEFTRQLGTMVEADIKLTEALGVLIAQTADSRLGQIIQNIRDQVVAGETLVDGLKQYPDWFDPIYVSMIRVGEVTGNLGRTLNLLADYLSKRLRLEAKIKSALTYPAFLVVVCVVVIIILMTFVVPKITNIITASGRSVPGITQFLIGVSSLFVNWWWALLLGFALSWYLLHRLVAMPKGRLFFDRMLLRLPVLGKILRQSVVARFTSTLATLIRSGLPIAESLETVAEVTGNSVMTEAIHRSRERIVAGADIATPLRESKVIDPAVAHMIAVGERTGELEAMLVTIAESMEENADISVQRISSVIEPCVIVIMAVVVGFIMFATLMPILEVPNLTGL
jgi:general secretion pathway protein F